MVVLTEKDLVPPPPYFAREIPARAPPAPNADPPTRRRTTRAPAPALPAHVRLLVVYAALAPPGGETAEDAAEREARTLHWMAFGLRRVDRGFYLAAMHLLRSTFLPAYARCVRAPYSSDPFPHSSRGAASATVVSALQSEVQVRPSPLRLLLSLLPPHKNAPPLTASRAQVLDLYILHSAHEAVRAWDSELHEPRPEAPADLFAFCQPRARLADLVRARAATAGLVSEGAGARNGAPRHRVPHDALRATFSPRRIGLVYAPPAPLSSTSAAPAPRTVVDLPRAPDEPLERAASRLVAGLRAWLDGGAGAR
ncbi:hypothetical protein DFH11DRAFT_1788072 [Phellopilus nigrolimitatus]|nr:hypothetical protein DFH11DRAFT_1788072 [Phellopilus nigrolimitatus]